jgi:serine/threonine-protein kinase
MSPLIPAVGIVVGNRYELTSRVAGGGMGEVWAARDQVLGRTVAVKLLRAQHADEPTFLHRFRTEARHAASLSHPGIASVYDYGEDDGAAYLVMELVPGEALSTRLQREGALAPAVAVPLLQQSAAALQAAHSAGLVHRDVKPANLLITPDDHVKITDFGIARLGDDAGITRTGEVMGTAQYLSPEQALGQSATPASDVYSLGVVAYEMLAGRRPFDADTSVAIAMAHVQRAPEPLPAAVPPAIAAVVLQALSKDPAQRPPTAAAFGQALGSALASPDTVVLPVTAPVAAPLPPLREDPVDRTAVLRPAAPVYAAPAAEPVAAAPLPAAPSPAKSRPLGGLLLGLLAAAAVVAVVLALLNQPDQGGTPAGGTTSTAPATVGTTPAAPTTSRTATRTQTPTPTTPTVTPTTTAPTTSAPTTTATPTTNTASPPPTTDGDTGEASITVDPTTYVGQPQDDVRGDLEALGLKTRVDRVRTDSAAEGTVLALSPAGPFRPDDTVTLQVAQSPPGKDDDDQDTQGSGEQDRAPQGGTEQAEDEQSKDDG